MRRVNLYLNPSLNNPAQPRVGAKFEQNQCYYFCLQFNDWMA